MRRWVGCRVGGPKSRERELPHPPYAAKGGKGGFMIFLYAKDLSVAPQDYFLFAPRGFLLFHPIGSLGSLSHAHLVRILSHPYVPSVAPRAPCVAPEDSFYLQAHSVASKATSLAPQTPYIAPQAISLAPLSSSCCTQGSFRHPLCWPSPSPYGIQAPSTTRALPRALQPSPVAL